MRQYIHSLMRDKKSGIINVPAKLALLIVSYVYFLLIKCNHLFYKAGILKIKSVPITVLSVGNITLGGTGKTPFTMMLAKILAKDKKVAVLIRGYGEDEHKMLKDNLKSFGVEVFVGRNRFKSAKVALLRGIGTIVMDDGFQHVRLKRDMDIVLIDSINPFGNNKLFPRGVLREPMSGLKRADIIVLTKTDVGDKGIALDKIRKIAPGKDILEAVHKPYGISDIKTGVKEDLDMLKGKNVALLSAICDPSYFKRTVASAGASVGAEFIYPDHYLYKAKDIEKVFSECAVKNIDTIVTTQKDAVKLRDLNIPDRPRMLVLEIGLEITKGKEILENALSGLYMRSSRKSA